MSSALDSLVFAPSVRAIQLSGHARQFVVVDGPLAGQKFQGTLRLETAINPTFDLGSDTREKCVLEVLRGEAPDFESQTTLLEGNVVGGLFVGQQKWKATQRDDNDSDVEIRYDVVKVLDGLDTP